MSFKDDPRLMVIGDRLRSVRNIVPIMSSKGGVGKTLVASLLALVSVENGLRTGLLDLDVTNPTTHIVLGIDPSKVKPIEEKGIIPPSIHGIRFMTIAYYSLENPVPLRGYEIDDVIREILAITQWGGLDILFIDTPPGLSDESLDVLTYFTNPRPLIVSTPSPLSIRSVERLLTLLVEQGINILGVVENMVVRVTGHIRDLCRRYGVKYLGQIPYDPGVDIAIGNIEDLRNTKFYKHLMESFNILRTMLI